MFSAPWFGYGATAPKWNMLQFIGQRQIGNPGFRLLWAACFQGLGNLP
jgi:hypothetical protein